MTLTKIALVTDSTSDISKAMEEALDIHVVPLSVNIDGKSYLDKIEITNEAFYEHIKTCEVLPTTSQVSPGLFYETYQKLHEEGYEHIISIHLSKTLSGTVDSARIASKMVSDEISVTVVDSLGATINLGLIVKALSKAIKEGKSVEEVVSLAEKLGKKVELYFLLDSLTNLEKGGRIGKASFLVGSLLNIKPILKLENGIIDSYDKVRGSKENKALIRLADIVSERIDKNKALYATIGYNSRKESAELLETLLRERGVSFTEVDYLEIGSVVSCHVGLGAAGIAFFQLD